MPKISEREYCGVYGLCGECGATVSWYTCNEDLIDKRPEAIRWDWWLACDSEGCRHHYGEGLFQAAPEWVRPTG